MKKGMLTFMVLVMVLVVISNVSASSEYTNEELVGMGLGDEYETDEPIKIWCKVDASVKYVFFTISSFPGEAEIVTVTLQILKRKKEDGNIAFGAVTIHQPGKYILSLRMWKGWKKKSKFVKKTTIVKKPKKYFEKCK
jgi:hypothetical protein